MENLDLFHLEKLNETQLKNIDGGALLPVIVAGIIIAAAAEIISDWDNFKNGLQDKPEE